MPLDASTIDPSWLAEGLIIDNFAGGGGASTGIELALGRSPDVAINHDAEAVALHASNHPDTLHLCQNVWKADPQDVVRQASARRCALLGIPFRVLPVRFAWFSPDCKHFSKAKGSKPVNKGIRGLAWVVVQWAKRCLEMGAPIDIIALENVEEFQDWGPLIETDDGKLVPCPVSKGATFRRWVRALKALGYKVDWRELRACDYGAPTIRKRLFVVARRDGKPIVWADPTHAKPDVEGNVGAGKLPWRTAAECIDWNLVCPSIFDRDRPLADNTLRRVARGVMRYVVNTDKPFIVGLAHGDSGGRREYSLDEPLTTIHGEGGNHAVVHPFISRVDQTSAVERNGIAPVDEPLRTLHTSNPFALIAPLTHHGGDRAHPVDEPVKTITAAHRGEMALIAPHVTKFRGGATGSPADEPMPTVTANSFIKRPGGAAPLGLVSASLIHRGNGEREGQLPRAMDVQKPLGTVVASGIKHGVVAASIARQFGTSTGAPADTPLGTVMADGGGKSQLVASFLAQHNTGNDGHAVREPVSTIVGKGCTQGVVECELSAEDLEGAQRVAAFIAKYYGQGDGQTLGEPLHTVTTKDRFCLVTCNGWPIVDIGLRMLQPRELYRAQGFPAEYVIDGPGPTGKPMTKTAQVRMCGNSVCPPIAQAIARGLVFGASAPEVMAAD